VNQPLTTDQILNITANVFRKTLGTADDHALLQQVLVELEKRLQPQPTEIPADKPADVAT
jgi:hypothetical protein